MINTKTAIAVAKAVALMLVASSAHAQLTNLVTNGGFEQTTLSQANRHFGGLLVLNNGTPASGLDNWTNQSRWSVVVPPSEISNILWTTANGGLKTITPSPDGGNFLTMDGDSTLHGALSQNISGLTPGNNYKLSFYSALGQQERHYGNTWDWMSVSFGSQQALAWATPGVPTQLPWKDFTGWQQFNYTFQATAANQALSFLAYGGPNGLPPLTLLDGVSLVDVTAPVPEPEEWAMMLVGAGLVSFQVRRKQAKVS